LTFIRGKKVEHLGTPEAPNQRAAEKAAIEKFERQSRLFVVKSDEKA
jgi:hypothetical protein